MKNEKVDSVVSKLEYGVLIVNEISEIKSRKFRGSFFPINLSSSL
jgi:hypothetical protein